MSFFARGVLAAGVAGLLLLTASREAQRAGRVPGVPWRPVDAGCERTQHRRGRKTFSDSMHGSLKCNDCHANIKDYPHPEQVVKVECKSCHADEAQGAGGKRACGLEGASLHELPWECAHDFSQDGFAVTVYPLNVPKTCGTCHGTEGMAKKHGLASVYPLYMDSIHGFALSKEGLLVAANCQSCHGSHHILSHNDPKSPTYKANIPKTCGSCHAKINDDYEARHSRKRRGEPESEGAGLHGLPHGARDSAADRSGVPHAVDADLRIVPQRQALDLPRYVPLATGFAGRLCGDGALLGLPRSARDFARRPIRGRPSTRPTW